MAHITPCLVVGAAQAQLVLWESRGAEAVFLSKESPAQCAQEAASVLQSRGVRGPLVLTPEADWCLPATVERPRQPRRLSPSLIAFSLEPSWPLALEEAVVDAVAHHDVLFGVAARRDELAPWVAALEGAGLHVAHICPWPLWQIQHRSAAAALSAEAWIVWPGSGGFDLVELRQRRPRRWVRVIGDARELQRELTVQRSQSPDHAEVWVPASSGLRTTELQERLGGTVRELPEESRPATTPVVPWIDLRCGGLADPAPYRQLRRWRRVAAVVAILLLVALGTASELYQRRVRERLERILQAEIAVFRDVLPGQRIPAGIRSRLESEAVKAEAIHQPTTELSEPAPACDALLAVLQAIPADVRFRVTDLQVDGWRVQLTGETRSHADAGRFADAFRRRGFQVGPLRTVQASAGVVSWTITGELRPTQERS